MNIETQNMINEIGSKIELINTLIRALTECYCGIEVLTERDGQNIIILLEKQLIDLKQAQTILENHLGI